MMSEVLCVSATSRGGGTAWSSNFGPGVVTVRELTAGLRQIRDRKGAKRFTSAEIEKRCAVTLNGEGHTAASEGRVDGLRPGRA